uniref:PAZ domain-containing protein n=1 Tax=Ditylenchus dipsaci TaxID=166011 RepID=A0A915EE59_9BILA
MEMLDDGIADVATTKTKIQECYKEFIKLQLTAKDCFHTLSKSAEMHLKSFSDLFTQVSEPEIKQEKVSAEPVSNKPSKKSTSSSSSRSSSSSSPEKGQRSSSSCNFRKANYKLKNLIKFAKELYPNQEITKSIASSVIELIKGYRVVTNYMEEKNCYFTLDNLTLRSADQVKFFGKQGNLTVADYFADNFFCLQYPHIPCAIYENRHNGKSRTFFYPLEAISVLTDGYNVKDVPYSNSNHETSNYKQPRNRSTLSKRKADDDFFTRMAREKDKKGNELCRIQNQLVPEMLQEHQPVALEVLSEDASKLSPQELRLLYSNLLREKERAHWQPSRSRPLAPLQTAPLGLLRHSSDLYQRQLEIPIHADDSMVERRAMKERRGDSLSFEQWVA